MRRAGCEAQLNATELEALGQQTLSRDRLLAYSIRIGDRVLGWSGLEQADPSMGVVYGVFHPAPDYSSVRSIFRLYAEAIPENTQQSPDGEKLRRYYQERDALDLLLVDARGRVVPTEAIHVNDFFEETGSDQVEVEVIVSHPSFWETYVPCV